MTDFGAKTAYLGHFRSDLDQTWHEGSQSDSDQLPLVWFRLTEHSVPDEDLEEDKIYLRGIQVHRVQI